MCHISFNEETIIFNLQSWNHNSRKYYQEMCLSEVLKYFRVFKCNVFLFLSVVNNLFDIKIVVYQILNLCTRYFVQLITTLVHYILILKVY